MTCNQNRTKKTLFRQSFYDANGIPDYVPKSFVQEKTSQYGFKYLNRYKVKDELYRYLSSVYNNSEKSKWETRLQEGIDDYSDKQFDMISINNTLGYIFDTAARIKILNKIFDKLKQGGIFITDPNCYEGRGTFDSDAADEIYKGIFRIKA